MILMIGQMILKRLLGRPETKKRVIEALRFEAAKTNTKIDDELVDAVEVGWDLVLPIVIGKL